MTKKNEPTLKEYVFYEKGKETIFLSFVPKETKHGLEASLASIEIHPVPPPKEIKCKPYSDLNTILLPYHNRKYVLSEIAATRKQGNMTVVIADPEFFNKPLQNKH